MKARKSHPPSGLLAGPGSSLQPPGCWTSFGVYGSRTCRELQRFIHCRNCPVYSRGALELLERPLVPDYRRECTEHFAAGTRAAETGHASAVLFRVGAEWLALPTDAFQEVAERRPIHSLPHQRSPVVLGLANVRGELLVCFSLGHLLEMDNIPAREQLVAGYQRLVVINWKEARATFPVDEVHGPHRFEEGELKRLPVTLARSRRSFTRQIVYWRGEGIGLLNPERVYSALGASFA